MATEPLSAEQIELLRSLPESFEDPGEGEIMRLRAMGLVNFAGIRRTGQPARLKRSVPGELLLATLSAEREKVLGEVDEAAEFLLGCVRNVLNDGYDNGDDGYTMIQLGVAAKDFADLFNQEGAKDEA